MVFMATYWNWNKNVIKIPAFVIKYASMNHYDPCSQKTKKNKKKKEKSKKQRKIKTII